MTWICYSEWISNKTYICRLAIWNKGNLHSFPKERLTLFHKKNKKKASKETQRKIFRNVFVKFWSLKPCFLGTCDISIFLQSKQPKVSIPMFSQSFYSCVFKSCSFLLFTLFHFCIFSIPLFCVPVFQTCPISIFSLHMFSKFSLRCKSILLSCNLESVFLLQNGS